MCHYAVFGTENGEENWGYSIPIHFSTMLIMEIIYNIITISFK